MNVQSRGFDDALDCSICPAVPAASPAAAEVVSASPNGFEIRHTVNLVAKPEVAFSSFANVGGWWDNGPYLQRRGRKHVRSSCRPGGCFCEKIPKGGGGIEHMRVSYVEPGKRVVLTGSLGPLLYEATAGVMDVQIKSSAAGSQLTLNYRAAGFAKGGADKLAPLVDQVLGRADEALSRLRDVEAADLDPFGGDEAERRAPAFRLVLLAPRPGASPPSRAGRA